MSELLSAPPTPDFAHYPWHGLKSARVNDDWVECRWADGASHRFYGLWLWENTVGRGIDPTTREMVVDPGDLPTVPIVDGVEIGDNGTLVIRWTDHSTDRLHPGWLRSIADCQQAPLAAIGDARPWPLQQWDESPPTIDGRSILIDDSVLQAWLTTLVRYGLARLSGVGDDPDFLFGLAKRIGPIRSTNFGAVFSVRSILNPSAEENSVANTGVMLGQHTDLPTRETPPGFQLLHCVANTASGGWATMTDGAALVEHLRRVAPEEHRALTTLRWIFANRSPDADHRWSAPMIELPESGRPLTLRCFYPVRAVPDMDEHELPGMYRAMRKFSELARAGEFAIRFPYAPGDLVAFDNRRVLHGRDAFDAAGGERHLRGCYFDHDDVYSRLRVLRRNRKGL